MKRDGHSAPVDLPPYDVIIAAVSGDVEALAQITRNFAAYLNRLAIREMNDKYGRKIYAIDLRRKAELSKKLIEATLTWKELI